MTGLLSLMCMCCSLVAAPPPSPPQYANLNDLRMASAESFSAQSPTDSGYRSAPRHLDAEPASTNSTGDGQPSLTTVVRVNGSPSQPQKLYNGSLDNTSSTRSSNSGVRLIQRQPTSASKAAARKMRSNPAGSLDTINTNVSLSEEFSLERCPKLIEVDRYAQSNRTQIAARIYTPWHNIHTFTVTDCKNDPTLIKR